MDPWVIITGVAVIVGIAAGIVQVVQYLQDRREKKRRALQSAPAQTMPIIEIPKPIVPENLPPCGEFIGRGKEKARVHEALASRWPLTCIDGIGGIGKTALALEVAHECLQASRAMVSEEAAEKAPLSDAFTAYEVALQQLLARLGRDHPRYSEVLVYQQRLSENVTQTRRYGESDDGKKERAEIIERLNGLSLSELNMSFNEACQQVTVSQYVAGSPVISAFDGFIWTSARDRTLTLNDILDTAAKALDYPGVSQQPLEEKQRSIQQLLRSNRYLLIVDNFETIVDETIREFLLWLPEPSKALITSREQRMPQAMAISLRGMEEDEALALIRSEGRRLGLAPMQEAPIPVLLRLYEATGGAPLAIKWAVGLIKQKGQSLDSVLAALHEARGNIFEQVFARSWSLLTAEARDILMVMPVFASTATRAVIEAASDVHHFALDEGLGQLVEMSLLEVSDSQDATKQRYGVHPLTKSFAQQKLEENDQRERETRGRAARYFLDFAIQYARENWRGFPTLEGEIVNIFGTMDWCNLAGEWQMLIEFTRALDRFLYDYSYWKERLTYAEQVQRAARAIGDDLSRARALTTSSWTLYYQGMETEALKYAQEAQEIFAASNDVPGMVNVLLVMGNIASRRGDFEQSSRLLREALASAQTQADQSLTYSAQAALAGDAYNRRDFGSLERQLDELLPTVDGLYQKGRIVGFRGAAALAQGKYEEARRFFEQALGIHQQSGRQIGIAHEKRGLAQVEEAVGSLQAALKLAYESLEMFKRWGTKKHEEETLVMVRRLEQKLKGQ